MNSSYNKKYQISLCLNEINKINSQNYHQNFKDKDSDMHNTENNNVKMNTNMSTNLNNKNSTTLNNVL